VFNFLKQNYYLLLGHENGILLQVNKINHFAQKMRKYRITQGLYLQFLQILFVSLGIIANNKDWD
jgi:uncharacterized membrane protein